MRRTRVADLAGLAFALAIVSTACGSTVSPRPTASSSPSVGVAPPVFASASTGAIASDGASPSASPGAGIAAADPDLFSVIPIKPADSLTFQYDGETTARVAADPGLGKDASAIAIGLYTVTGQQPVADYAIASVVKLRDPKADDNWFRTYRDSYDESACAQAGGVSRHAEAAIAGRTVFIGSCAGGAFTYHLRLDAQGVVVSITGVGPGRLGEKIAGLVAP